MTDEVCPACKGAGRCASQRNYNRVSGGVAEETVCWMCGGSGRILKQETNHQFIHKYWSSGGKDAIQDSQGRQEMESN